MDGGDSSEGDCCFCPDTSTNSSMRGPTDKQPDASPLDESMRKAIESRTGKSTGGQSQMSSGRSALFDLS